MKVAIVWFAHAGMGDIKINNFKKEWNNATSFLILKNIYANQISTVSCLPK
jgi:hypothetical protein